MIYEEYKTLITRDHKTPRDTEKDRTNFDRFVEAILTQGIEAANMLSMYHEIFSVENAYGELLDIIGNLVGASRKLEHSIGDIGRLDYDSENRNDDPYRLLIYATIAANSWDGTNENLVEILKTIFSDYNITYVDNQDMTITFNISGDISTMEIGLLENIFSILTPAGVGMSCNVNSEAVYSSPNVFAGIVGEERVEYVG